MELDDLRPDVRVVAIQPYQWWGDEQWAEYRRINTDDDVSDEELENVLQALEQWALVSSRYSHAPYKLVIDPSWTHHISFFDMNTFQPKGVIE